MKFTDLGLSENLLKAIEECGYDTPTPIQEKAIPHILMARDVVGLAQTGTGKTAAFTMPMIEILEGGRARARMPRSLILSPTRELAAQIAENFETYGKHGKLEKALLVGGVSMDEQIKKLDRGVDVLIATPGRLLDLFERGRILLTDIKLLVIDEADRMLDMGFIPDIKKIVSFLSPMRQTLLFSATMPDEIQKLTESFLSNPRTVEVAPPASTSKNVTQYLVKTHSKEKDRTLLRIIERENVKNAFVFCNRKRDIAGLKRFLQNNGYAAGEMHGDMVQSARMKTLKSFKDGEITLLICSDVAARGIDVDNVSHVFNYDVPKNPDDYVHRVGRTGRAGNEGHAWTLSTKYDQEMVDKIVSLTGVKFANAPKEIKETDDRGSNKQQSRHKKNSRTQDKTSPNKKDGDRNRRHSKPRDNDNNDEKNDVIGFGDDMPAFFN